MKKVFLQLIIISTFSFVGNSQNLTQHSKLEAFDLQLDDNLAISAGASGDYAIAGAWHEDHDSIGGSQLSNAGSAYIYHYNSTLDVWETEAKLVASDRSAGDVFGTSVDIHSDVNGTYAVIGAVEENAARGAAYVFERGTSGGWTQVAKLVAPTRQSSDRFGYSVAIYDTTIVVGAYHEDEDVSGSSTLMNAGSAYIYTRTGGVWGFFQKIVASDRNPQDYFGYSVGIHESHLIVGAYRYDPNAIEIGGAYTFSYSMGAWGQTNILTADSSHLGDRFGWSVDVHDPYYIVGAPYHDYDDTNGNAKGNAGAAYIYDASNSWSEEKVVEGDRFGQDNLGEAVAIYDTLAVVGAPGQNYDLNGAPPLWSDAGAAYVYKKDGSGSWNQTQKLLTDNRFSEDKLGTSVAIYGTTVFCGAPEDNRDSPVAIPSTGVLYVFKEATNVGVSATNLNSLVKVYPNPANGNFNIEVSKMGENIQYGIYNGIGQLIQNGELQVGSSRFSITQGSGIYYLKIWNSQGHSSSRAISIY